MPTSETTSNVTTSNELSKTIKEKITSWSVATVDPLLFILHITVVYVLFLLGDTLILAVIGWSFGDIVKQQPFAEKLLEGVKLLSALGTAVAYALHLIYSLYQEGKHIAKVIREDNEKKEQI
jgi:hypothetical protein